MRLSIVISGTPFDRMAQGVADAATPRFRGRMVGLLNRAGATVHKAIIPALEQQTGLYKGTIPRAVKTERASASSLTFILKTQGGDVSLKYFNPQEGGGGVTASPQGNLRRYAGAFMTSGRQGGRKRSPLLNGHVYMASGVGKTRKGAGKSGSWWRKIYKLKSGVIIPAEMVRGKTLAAFEAGVATDLMREADALLATLVAPR